MTKTKLFGFALAALLVPALVTFVTTADANKRKRRSRKAQIIGKVNLNTAKIRQLTLLPRIGRATAKRIVAYRASKPFQAIRDLMHVKGIGKATFLKAKPHLSVRGPNTLRRVKPRGTKRRRKGRRSGAKKRRQRRRG